MITPEEALAIHKMIIEKFGGKQGVRDSKLLETVLDNPFVRVEEKEIYTTPEEKAASLIEGIVRNKPFFDGNKRTAYVLMRLMLIRHKSDLTATDDEKYEFVMQVASGNMYYTDMVHWIRERMVASS